MFKYIRLQLFLVSKKVSTYLVPAVFFLIAVLSFGLVPLLSNSPHETLSAQLQTPYNLILPFIVTTIFVAIKALNIFKESEEDGSELLIVSKPITRTKIVLGKFLSLYILITLFSIFILLSAVIVAQMDPQASSKIQIEFAASLFIGSFIVMLLMSSFIILFASIFGKIGTMVLSIFIPVLMTISSLIMTFSSNANYNPNNTNFVIRTNNDSKIVKIPFKSKNNNTYYNHHEDSWYSTASYFDAWAQVSGLYSAAQTNKQNSSLLKWRKTNFDSNILNKALSIKDSANNVYILQDVEDGGSYSFNKGNSFSKNIKIVDDAFTANKMMINYINNVINNALQGKNEISAPEVLEEINNVLGLSLTKSHDQKLTSAYALVKIWDNKDFTIPKSKINFKDHFSGFGSSFIKKDNFLKNNEGLSSEPYVPYWFIYSFWISTTIIVSALVILRYMRRDFK